MAINLTKGGRVNLSKDENGQSLSTIFFGANWGAIHKSGFLGLGGHIESVDLDATAVMLDANKNKLDHVYFGQRTSHDGSIHHSGDDLVGDTNGDDGMDNEVISVNLDRVDPNVQYVAFILNSYRHHKFDEIPYMGLRIYATNNNRPVSHPSDTPNVLATYNLANDNGDNESTFQGREAIILGYAYRKDGEWKFKATGNTGTWRSISEIESNLAQFL